MVKIRRTAFRGGVSVEAVSRLLKGRRRQSRERVREQVDDSTVIGAELCYRIHSGPVGADRFVFTAADRILLIDYGNATPVAVAQDHPVPLDAIPAQTSDRLVTGTTGSGVFRRALSDHRQAIRGLLPQSYMRAFRSSAATRASARSERNPPRLVPPLRPEAADKPGGAPGWIGEGKADFTVVQHESPDSPVVRRSVSQVDASAGACMASTPARLPVSGAAELTGASTEAVVAIRTLSDSGQQTHSAVVTDVVARAGWSKLGAGLDLAEGHRREDFDLILRGTGDLMLRNVTAVQEEWSATIAVVVEQSNGPDRAVEQTGVRCGAGLVSTRVAPGTRLDG